MKVNIIVASTIISCSAHPHTHTHTLFTIANVSGEAIREAIHNEIACYPALLTLSQIILQVANK